MASAEQNRRRARVLQLQARARAVQAAPTAPIDSPPTLGPSTATPMTRPTMTERATDLMQGLNRSLLSGMTIGASPSMLGVADAALGRGSVPEMVTARQRELEATDPRVRMPAEVLGGVATGGLMAPGRTVAQQYLLGSGLGGLYGFNVTPGALEERAVPAMAGAGAGAAGTALSRGLGRLISPQSSPSVQAVKQSGVEITPGQALGGAGRRAEEIAKSAPILGDFVRAAEKRGLDQFNIAATNQALAPLGRQIPPMTNPGRSVMKAARNIFRESYEEAIPSDTVLRYTREMADDISQVGRVGNNRLDDKGRRVIQGAVDRIRQTGDMRQGMKGSDAQDVLSYLRREQRQFGASQDPWDQRTAEVLNDLEDVFQNQLEIAVGPERAGLLRNANAAYANWKRIERAGSMLGAEEGVFTPAQLQNATRALDRSTDKAAFNRGEALMQNVSEPAKAVLAPKYPDSGTVGRGLGIGGALATGGGMIDPLTAGTVAGGLTGAGLMGYTPPAQRALANALAGRQGPNYQAIRALLQQGAPVAGAASGMIGANATRRP